jgi:hypothetical protein
MRITAPEAVTSSSSREDWPTGCQPPPVTVEGEGADDGVVDPGAEDVEARAPGAGGAAAAVVTGATGVEL